MVGPALAVARQYSIPLIVDLHENYPSMIEATRKSVTKSRSIALLVQKYLVSVERWKHYESIVVPQVTAVIVVIEEALSRMLELGVTKDRIVVVANYTNLSGLDRSTDYAYRSIEDFNVVYVDGFAATRDLRTVIDAVALIPVNVIPELRVQLLGGQSAKYESICAYSREKNVEDRVKYYKLAYHT